MPHVDGLFITGKSQSDLDLLAAHLDTLYEGHLSRQTGKVLDYVGMTFNYEVAGEVSVTMGHMVKELLKDCDELRARATPAAEVLFNISEATKLGADESKFYHSKVAQALYLSKRVRSDCLTAVVFLTTWVAAPEIDDMAKLRRVLGYGVHQDSGKPHTGCVIVLGAGGPLYTQSSKQKIVTKSSTEAELMGMSDAASQAIHLRKVVRAQGYDIGPAMIYQDNVSCIALVRRGGHCSARSRHINIRHFWLHDREREGEVVLEHMGAEWMWANPLTKPMQGRQFVLERAGLTNWRGAPAE